MIILLQINHKLHYIRSRTQLVRTMLQLAKAILHNKHRNLRRYVDYTLLLPINYIRSYHNNKPYPSTDVDADLK